MSWFGHSIDKVYYKFNNKQSVGPTGDYVEAGVYWTNKLVPALHVQADNVWVSYSNNIERSKPEVRVIAPDTECTWLRLTAKQLRWFD